MTAPDRTTNQQRSPLSPSMQKSMLAMVPGLRAFERKRGSAVPTLGECLRSEEKPGFVALSAIAQQVARDLPISPALQQQAIGLALNLTRQKELHRELTTGQA